ncbi:molecular chaperone [Entomohabitans teleogrylli]|uniref:fimbrial biogenesis chaperone n=1 Tax=Entomohabitans teleogrylli TaxID=1384589 RepID=UPI00073D626C|nr:fimbria/pilus periplasmic chaperone [Entomohabitans teleogrylli]
MNIRRVTAWSGPAACLAVILCFPAAHAGVVIDNTRVIYASDAREVTVRLTNLGKRAVLVQSWLDNGDEMATPDKVVTPFVLTPPINRVEPGKGQSLRISAASASALRQDRESLWWLNVLEIPARPDNRVEQQNYLQLAVRTRIKFFYRPAGLRQGPTEAVKSLTWTQGNSGLTVNNPSPFHISLTSVAIAGKKVAIEMVSPMDRRTYSHARAPRGSTITATWVDDYGAYREQTFTVN